VFVGLERNVESIRSFEGADIVWIEEARTVSAKSLEILLPTIRKRNSELIWTWNPEQPEDPVDQYFRKGEPPPRAIVTKVSYLDNPFFKETEMPAEMEMLKRGNYQRYLHVWEGEYDTRFESKVFPHATTGRIEIPPDLPPVYGMDFGFGSDPSFVVKAYLLHQTRQIYVAAEASGKVPMDHLPQLARSVLYDDGDFIRADSSNPAAIEFLNSRGLNVMPAKKGPGSVKAGILFLQGFEIIIDPNCEEFREEARLYSWMTERLTGRILSTPVDAYNHGWDALRYAVEDAVLDTALDGDPNGGVLKLKLW
jgi:phage terminase large subunit